MSAFSLNDNLGGTPQNLSSTYKTLVEGYAPASLPKRGKVYELSFGASGAPNATDCIIDCDVSPMTAVGSQAGTAVTPTNRDTSDVSAAVSICKAAMTTEATVTASASIWRRTFNQRGAYQWFARDEFEALIWPTTSANGLVARAKSATYASTMGCEMDFLET